MEDIVNSESKKITYIDCLTEENGTRYFVPCDYHCLIKENIKSEKMEIVTYFKNIPYKQKNTYVKIFKWKEKIICLPLHAAFIAVVNEKSRGVEYLKIPQIEKSKIQYSFFMKGMQIGKYIYAIGLSYFGILKIDCESLEIEVIDEWMRYYKENSVCEKKICFSQNYFRAESKIYLICSEFPSVLLYDFKKEVYEFIDMKKWAKELVAVSGTEDNLYIVTDEGKILSYNYNSETRMIEEKGDISGITKQKIRNIYTYDNNLHILSLEDKAFICMNETMECINRIEMPLDMQNINGETPYDVQIDVETILVCYSRKGKMWKYSLKDKRFYNYEVPIKKGVFDLKSYIKEHCFLLINEDCNIDFTLNSLLNVIKEN